MSGFNSIGERSPGEGTGEAVLRVTNAVLILSAEPPAVDFTGRVDVPVAALTLSVSIPTVYANGQIVFVTTPTITLSANVPTLIFGARIDVENTYSIPNCDAALGELSIGEGPTGVSTFARALFLRMLPLPPTIQVGSIFLVANTVTHVSGSSSIGESAVGEGYSSDETVLARHLRLYARAPEIRARTRRIYVQPIAS